MRRRQLAATRIAEQRAAADVLGVSEIVHLGYPDGYLTPSLDLRRDIARQIRRFRPDLVIAQNPQRRLDHNPFIGHPDHLATGEATLASVYPAARDRLNFPELARDEGLEPWKVRQVLLTGVERAEPVGRRGGDIRDGLRRSCATAARSATATSRCGCGERAEKTGEPQGIGMAQAFLSIVLGMMRRGGGWGGGADPDLTRRPGSDPRTMRRIIGFFDPYRGRLAIIAISILASVSIGVVNPILLKLIIDNLLGPRDIGLLYLQTGLMIVLPIVTSLIGVGQSYLSNVVGQNVMNDLRLALYRHLQGMPLRFFTETRTGEIQSRVGNDVNGVQSVVTDTAASLLSNLATVATTIIAMLVIDWRLTALSLGMLPVFAYITYRVGKVRRQIATLTQQSLAEVSAITEESLSVSGILLQQDVRPAGGLDRPIPARVAPARRPADPSADDRPLVLRADRHLLLDHARRWSTCSPDR